MTDNLRAGNPVVTDHNLNLCEEAFSDCSTVPNCIHMRGHTGIALELRREKRQHRRFCMLRDKVSPDVPQQ